MLGLKELSDKRHTIPRGTGVLQTPARDHCHSQQYIQDIQRMHLAGGGNGRVSA